MTLSDGYTFERGSLAELIIRKAYPERTTRESAVIRDFLRAHGEQFDRFAFSVRVGQGVTPNPEHMDGVQRSTAWSSRKRIDLLLWRGDQPTIGEVKERVGPGTLGQLLGYRQLWLEENADAVEPTLIAIGRYSDDDTIRILTQHGISVYLFDAIADE